MKKGMILMVTVLMISFLAFPISSFGAPPKTTLRLVVAWEKDFPLISGPLEKIIQLTNEKTKGEIEIKHMGGPEMIPANDMLEAIKSGQIDMAQTHDGYYSGVVPETNILDIPFLWTDKEQLLAYYAVRDKINEYYRQKLGCRMLALSSVTSHLVFTKKKPINNSQDMEGLKLRIPGGLYGAGPRLFKATPVNIPVAEVMTALDRGIIDGTQWAELAVVYYNGDQFLKYVTDFQFSDTKVFFYLSEKAWNNLPPHLQKAMEEVAKEIDQFAFVCGKKTQKEAREKLKKRGVTYIKLDPAEEKKWKTVVVQEMVKKAISVSPKNGKEILEAIKPYTHYDPQ